MLFLLWIRMLVGPLPILGAMIKSLKVIIHKPHLNWNQLLFTMHAKVNAELLYLVHATGLLTLYVGAKLQALYAC